MRLTYTLLGLVTLVVGLSLFPASQTQTTEMISDEGCCVIFAVDEIYDQMEMEQLVDSVLDSHASDLITITTHTLLEFGFVTYPDKSDARIVCDFCPLPVTPSKIHLAIEAMTRLMQDDCPLGYRKFGVLFGSNVPEPALAEEAATAFKQQGSLLVMDPSEPTTTPIPTTSECLQSEFIHGIYIFNSKDYCYAFHSCTNYYQAYSLLRVCAFGQFFDNRAATCIPANSVDCANDPCKIPGTVSYTNHLCCRSYFVCDDLRTVGEECCPEGQAYVDQVSKCQDDVTCDKACPPEPRIADCTLKPYAGDLKRYQQDLGGDNWKVMDCPTGTHYNDANCRCSDSGQPRPAALCTHDIYMPLDKNVQDVKRRKFVVKKRVQTVDDANAIGGRAAKFQENSRLIVRGYANSWWGDKLTIQARFMETDRSSFQGDAIEVIFGNGACNVEASVSVKCDRVNNRVTAFIRTDEGGDTPFTATVAPVSRGAFKEVELRYDGENLRLTIDNQVDEVEASGNIMVTRSPLQLGNGCRGDERFTGLIYEFYVYRCNPV